MNKKQTTAELTTSNLMRAEQIRLSGIPEEYAILLSLICESEKRALKINESLDRSFWNNDVIDLADDVLTSICDGLYKLCSLIGSQMGSRVHEPERVAQLGFNKEYK